MQSLMGEGNTGILYRRKILIADKRKSHDYKSNHQYVEIIKYILVVF